MHTPSSNEVLKEPRTPAVTRAIPPKKEIKGRRNRDKNKVGLSYATFAQKSLVEGGGGCLV